MDLHDTPALAAHRQRVREWLDAHHSEAPDLGAIADMDERISVHRRWQRVLADAGYAGITWPTEFGGQGLGPAEQLVADQEITRAGAPGVLDIIGIGMLGPTIMALGTEGQKERHLAPMLRAEEVWCQLFSEPAAGSDLAGVQARAAVTDDDHWIVNGQKVWTTNAQVASFGLLLARTSPEKPKHRGLTMFIVPMDNKGVTVRGLRQISGEAEFNEVFLDDVRLGPEAVLGEVDDGWKAAMTTLMFERFTLGAGADHLGYSPERYAAAICVNERACRSPEVRFSLGQIATELIAARFGGYRMLTELLQGRPPGPEAGLAKITTVTAGVKAGELILDVLGLDALHDEAEWGHWTSYVAGLKFGGGTEEILRNTIGERVLGLPPEPRMDKDIPFSELRTLQRNGNAAIAASS